MTATLTAARIDELVESLAEGQQHAEQRPAGMQEAYLLGWMESTLIGLVDELAGAEAAKRVREAMAGRAA